MFKWPESYNAIEKTERGIEIHRAKCQKFFDNIKSGEPLYVRIEREILEQEPVDEVQYIRISLLHKEIVEYDLAVFDNMNKEELIKNYRPYFASFSAWLRYKNIRKLHSLDAGWYFGKFTNTDETVNECIQLEGFLETSASPVSYLDGRLLIFNNTAIPRDELKKIHEAYNLDNFTCVESATVEKVLNDAWDKDFPNTIDVYNIGHGNADYIRGSKNRILYDVGYNYRTYPQYHESRYLKAVRAIRNFKPSCVILSHWDMDHIIGCAYAQQDIFNKIWVAPNLISSKDRYVSVNAIRLARYLRFLGNLYLVNREQTKQLIATLDCKKGVEIKLWLGRGTSRLTAKNREGLLIEICDENQKSPHVLLAGDVPYKCMPDILNTQINFLHVPHHCSAMELERLKKMPRGECAVISTNEKSDKRLNYNALHHTVLTNKFDNVIHTIDSIWNNVQNLSVQFNYKKNDFKFRQ